MLGSQWAGREGSGAGVHAHLLQGLLLLGRQGRQPQLCSRALSIFHLDGVCPLGEAGIFQFKNLRRPSQGRVMPRVTCHTPISPGHSRGMRQPRAAAASGLRPLWTHQELLTSLTA